MDIERTDSFFFGGKNPVMHELLWFLLIITHSSLHSVSGLAGGDQILVGSEDQISFGGRYVCSEAIYSVTYL